MEIATVDGIASAVSKRATKGGTPKTGSPLTFDCPLAKILQSFYSGCLACRREQKAGREELFRD